MMSLRGAMLLGLTALALLASSPAHALPSLLGPARDAVTAASPSRAKMPNGQEMQSPFEDSDQAQCVSKCQDPMSRCMNACKKSDKSCPGKCAERMVSCSRGCGMKVPNENAVRKAQGGNLKH